MEEIGEIKESTTSSFVFRAKEDVRKHDYVRVGDILAQIWEIKQQSNGTFVYANIIGASNRRYMPRSPFKIGSPVYRAEEEFAKKILGIERDGIYIGLLKDTRVKVFLSPDVLIQKHLCILAKSGSGKSYVMGVVIEEFMKRDIPVVIIDPHGEYVSLRRPNLDKQELSFMRRFDVKPRGYAKQVYEFAPICSKNRDAIPLYLDETNLSFQDLLNLVPNATPLQKGVLYEACNSAMEKKFYLLKDILEGIQHAKSNARWNLIPQIEQIISMKLFSVNYTPLNEIVKKGRCSIINLRGVPPYIQELLVAVLLTKIFEERKAGSLPPVLLVLEEAHRYAPERGQGKSFAGTIIKTIASEGRKFGVGLAIVSQRAARVDKNVLSQCNAHITLKTTNPNDLKAIVASVEGLDAKAADEIQMLPVGTAIVAGLPLAAPIFTEIRPRETLHGGKLAQL
ncbi:MAG TPA: ATP-binding protein [Thermoplasmatales archaeon]|nr:MAG: ATP-binding protein [Thermoplasmata archaeon]HDN50424.1 ATP-binding protein [Thermoplasmatales archaeon]